MHFRKFTRFFLLLLLITATLTTTVSASRMEATVGPAQYMVYEGAAAPGNRLVPADAGSVFEIARPLALSAVDPADYYGKSALATLPNSGSLLYAYEQMAAGIEGLQEQISIQSGSYAITLDELKTVFTALAADYPEFFWLDVTGYRYATSNGQLVAFLPTYSFTAAELPAEKARFEAAAQKVLAKANLTTAMGDYEKALAIHDALAGWIEYDLTAEHPHTAYGALVEHRAVCDGYARSYQYLLNQAGILSHIAEGSSINPSTGISEGHAWNLVRLDGAYYHTDLTWNDQETELFYAFLNMTDQQLLADHAISDVGYPYPECTATAANYYTKNPALAPTGSDYSDETFDAIVNQLKSGSFARVQFSGDTPESLTTWYYANIEDIAVAAGASEGERVGYGYSYIGQECHLKLFFADDYTCQITAAKDLEYTATIPYEYGSNNPTYTVVQACYNPNGVLTELNMKDLTVRSPGIYRGYLRPEGNINFQTVKYMLWNGIDSATPHCAFDWLIAQ